MPAFPMSLNPQQFGAAVQNIRNIYEATPEEVRRSAHEWYPQAHQEAVHIGRGSAAQGAGIISALSPSTDWDLNRFMGHQLSGMSSADEAAIRSGDRSVITRSPLNHQSTENIVKALDIRAGADPFEALLSPATYDESVKDESGRVLKNEAGKRVTTRQVAGYVPMKRWNFARNIAVPEDPDAVTIDTHAHDIAYGSKLPYKFSRGLSPVSHVVDGNRVASQGRYGQLADAYRAARMGYTGTAHEMQAATWHQWRQLHGSDERMNAYRMYGDSPWNPRNFGFR